jgi:hypothetical protein
MTILTTRTLHYVDDDGVMKEVTMTLLDSVDEDGTRKIVLRFGRRSIWRCASMPWTDVQIRSSTF